jgi:hypothetical protein
MKTDLEVDQTELQHHLHDKTKSMEGEEEEIKSEEKRASALAGKPEILDEEIHLIEERHLLEDALAHEHKKHGQPVQSPPPCIEIPSSPDSSSRSSVYRLPPASSIFPQLITEENLKKHEVKELRRRRGKGNGGNGGDNSPFRQTLEDEQRQVNLMKLTVREENLRLGLSNLGPRSAYLHRISVLVECLSSFHLVFDERGEPFNLWEFIFCCVRSFVQYWVDMCMHWISLVHYVFTTLLHWNDADPKHRKDWYLTTHHWLNHNIQALKIAAAVAIMGSLLIYEKLPMFYQGGLWATSVIVLIRQENTSSSFLMAYQRLEGTVIGAIYAFFIYQIFQCDQHECGMAVQVPTLMVWLLVCAYFREGPQHGYAATVAGFTPILLLIGTSSTLAGAWGRIEETFFGIVLYLIIDNVIMPRRIYPSITASVLSCISETKSMISESFVAVEMLMNYEAEDHKHKKTKKAAHDVAVSSAIAAANVLPSGEEGEANVTQAPRSLSMSSLLHHFTQGTNGLYGPTTDVRFRSGTLLSGTGSVMGNDGASRIRKNSIFSIASSTNNGPVPSSAVPSVVASSITHAGNNTLIQPFSPPPEFLVSTSGKIELTRLPESIANIASEQELFSFSDKEHREFLELFHACKLHLDKSDLQLKQMKAQLALQSSLLSMVVHEPELWHRSFPLVAYSKLHHAFNKVYRSGLALTSGSRAFSVVLCQMLKREEEHVNMHLSHFRYMTRHLFHISAQADKALTFTLEAFQR